MRLPRGNQVVTNRQTSTGMVQSEETARATRSVGMVMNFVDDYLEKESTAKAQDMANHRERRINEWKQQNFQRSGKSATGMTEEFDSFIKQIDGELASSAGRRTKDKFNAWASRSTEAERISVMQFQHKQDLAVRENAFKEGVSLADETVRLDAKNWQKASETRERTFQAALDSGVLSHEEYGRIKQDDDNRFRTELGKLYYTQDRNDFMKNLDRFGFGEPEKEAYRKKYKNDLEAEKRELKAMNSEEAKSIWADRGNMKAQAVMNRDTSHYYSGANRLEKLGYSEWAKELREAGQMQDKNNGFFEERKGASLISILQDAQSLALPKELDGAESEMRAIQSIQQEARELYKAYRSDPAQYVDQFALADTPELRAQSRLSLQADQGGLGVASRVLTNQERDNFKGMWESGDTVQKTEFLKNMLSYGEYAPQALDELKINSALSLTPMLVPDGNQRDLDVLVTSVAGKPTILEDTATKTDYTADLRESDFYRLQVSLQQRFPTNDGLMDRLEDVEKMMMGISARHVDATAGRKFIDSRLSVINEGDKMIYVPRSVDEDEISYALSQRKSEIRQKYSTGNQSQDWLTKAAVREAVWVNSGAGFALMDEKSGRILPNSEVRLTEIDSTMRDFAAKQRGAKQVKYGSVYRR